jgi:hypothetical protein
MVTANKYYTDATIHARSIAYCKGFVDGYYDGCSNNPFNNSHDILLYKIGYDAGVTEYCNETHPEE